MYCPNGHGPKTGNYCDECREPLIATPHTGGDALRIRSPEAHATVNILPGGHGAAPGPSLVKCPRCGRRNAESSTFDCQGGCERQHLCERHFDEEYEVCQDCAARLRKTAEAAAAERQALEADRAAWRSQAEQTERELAAAQDGLHRAAAAHAAVKAELEGKVAQASAAGEAAAARTATLEQEAQTQRSRAAELTRQLADARRSLAEAEAARAAAQTALATADKNHAAAQQTLQGRLAALEKSEAGWRSRAESAEAQLAEFRRKEATAEAIQVAIAEVWFNAAKGAAHPPLSPGTTLAKGKYTVDRLLGEGASGYAFLAHDQRRRSFCIKQPKWRTPNELYRFSQEVALLRLLARQSSHFPQVEEVLIENPSGVAAATATEYLLVEEFVPGYTLESIWIARQKEKQGPFAESDVIKWTLQLLDALSNIHNLGIVHGDINPSNVMLLPDGQHIKIIDMGITPIAGAVASASAVSGRILFPGFVAPEQYAGVRHLGRFTDIYAVGAIMYLLLTGTAPVDSLNRASGVQHLIPPYKLNARISPMVKDVILQAMALDASLRYQSSDEMLAALNSKASTDTVT